ncbi:MAG TPA: hypothetical protein VII11_03495 [Bacteroidota bacterium]
MWVGRAARRAGRFAFPEILVEIIRNFNESRTDDAACVKLPKLEMVSN